MHQFDCKFPVKQVQCSLNSSRKGRRLCTFGEFSDGILELKPKIKLDCWTSLFCGFQEMEADRQEALPNLDTTSTTF